MRTKEIYFALTILGLGKTELPMVMMILDLAINKQYGEIPGKNLRTLLDLTKDSLFDTLEKLVAFNILTFSNKTEVDKIYVKAGAGSYVFNTNHTKWLPSQESLFYKICKSLGYRFTEESYNYIVTHYSVLDSTEQKVVKDEKLTPYELYDLFCKSYKETFGKEYRPSNQARDLGYMKKVIFDCSYKHLSDAQIKEFLYWCFSVKVKDFKGEFLVGFLPLCLKDYFAANVIKVVKPGYKKDENGNLRKIE